MIKLIVSDMDGTLLNGQIDISCANLEAIQKAKENGTMFAIATGRHFDEATSVLNKYDIRCPLITANGAAIYNQDWQLQETFPLNHQRVIDCLTLAERFSDVYCEIMTSDGVVSQDKAIREEKLRAFIRSHQKNLSEDEFEQFFNEKLKTLPVQFVSSLHSYITKEQPTILKLFILSAKPSVQLEQYKQILKGEKDIAISSSHPLNLEINAVNAQKGIAVAQLAKSLGLTMDNVMAIGDNLNDLSMITAAKFGIAMGNALEEVKHRAHAVTDDYNHDGVAKAIQNYVLDGKEND